MTARLKRVRSVSQEVQQRAEQLRREATPAEDTLWKELRDRQVAGTKFRRQAPLGRFILDFYAPSCKLVVEVDGSIHDTQIERDAERSQHLQAYGYTVLRFRNDDVLHHMPHVLEQIAHAITTLNTAKA